MNHLTFDRNNVLDLVTVFDASTREVIDIYVNNKLKTNVLGNIYACKIISIVDGMDGAFVDIGLSENAFIQRNSLLRALGVKPSKVTGEPLAKLVKKGQLFIGQVDKAPYQSKGAQITHDISIAGRTVVLKPFMSGVKVSKKVGLDNERDLFEIALKKKLANRYGAILRSAALSEGANIQEVEDELESLINVWETIKRQFSLVNTTKALYHNRSIETSLEFLLTKHDVKKCHVAFEVDKMTLLSLGMDKKDIMVRKVETALYQEMGIDLDAYLKTVKFMSKEGISITLNELEAFTVIDVNSFKYKMDFNKREKVFEVNARAADLILSKLLTFNISGIILIDFIDMAQDERLSFIQHLLDKGYNKLNDITIEGFTSLGILEITRKRFEPSLKDVLSFDFETKDLKFWDLFQLKVELSRMKHHTNTEQVIVEVETSLYQFLRQNDLFSDIDIKVKLKHHEGNQKNYKLHTSKH